MGSVSLLLGAVAGVTMVVGAILRWTKVSVELRRFALGESASGFRLRVVSEAPRAVPGATSARTAAARSGLIED